MTIYTIGHSTRTLEEFISILQHHGIRTLVDIRAYPVSRRMPWFQGPQKPSFMSATDAAAHEALESTLPRAGIQYVWMAALGGRRGKSRTDSPNVALTSPAFRNYADYMLTEPFHAGIEQLFRLEPPVAIMCAEAQVYWHCHRMLVSDYLVGHGHEVLHIRDLAAAKPHRLTPEARLADGELIYDAGRLF